MSKSSVVTTQVVKVRGGKKNKTDDLLAVEEPLEIRLSFGAANQREEKRISVTMRTPSNDFELALGFLYNENIITHFAEVRHIRYCHNVEKQEEKGNVVKVSLQPDFSPNLQFSERNFYTNSSCGVCGKTSIDAIKMKNCAALSVEKAIFSAKQILSFGDILNGNQTVFKRTGGLHGAGLFDSFGKLLLIREDVGRHNAVDKVVGAALYKGLFPLKNTLLFLSGRISFELVQKAIVAKIPIIVAFGAPSSLAVKLASAFNITLIGFIKNDSFNIYSKAERIIFSE